MFAYSFKFLHKFIIYGLLIVLCLIYIENLYSKQLYNNIFLRNKSDIRKIDNEKTTHAVSTTDGIESAEAQAIVLWWTPFIDEMEYTKNCGGNSVCFFTGNRDYIHHKKLKVSFDSIMYTE